MEEKVQLLVKENFNFHGDETYKLIDDNQLLVSGIPKNVIKFMSRNELFELQGEGSYVKRGWRYATNQEVDYFEKEAKIHSGFSLHE